jgi:hypothetical protein
VNGWPTIATQATRHRYILDGVLVGAYEDDEALRQEFDALMAVARRNTDASRRVEKVQSSHPKL